MLAATHALLLSQYHCPPSCHNNELGELLDRFCSDKGTFWQSKHHYHTAYHSVFGSIRKGVRSILEVGIGEDTAPSVAAWTEYFPNAHIFPVDIKSRQGFDDRAKPGGATAGVAKHQAKFGCVSNASMWKHPRVHLTLDTDASEPAQLQRIPNLPELLDIIIDDGSHRFHDQETMLLTLAAAAPPASTSSRTCSSARCRGTRTTRSRCRSQFWRTHLAYLCDCAAASSSLQVPTATWLSNECFFPQRLAEHPFIVDRFASRSTCRLAPPRAEAAAGSRAMFGPRLVLGDHRRHRAEGMDTTTIIRNSAPPTPRRPASRWRPPRRSRPAGVAAAAAMAWRWPQAARARATAATARFSQLEEQVRPATAGGYRALRRRRRRRRRRRPRPRACAAGEEALLLDAVFNYVQARQVDALRTKGAASSR